MFTGNTFREELWSDASMFSSYCTSQRETGRGEYILDSDGFYAISKVGFSLRGLHP